jgi:hypothetical protein
MSATKEHELPKEIVERGPQVVSELGKDEPDTGFGSVAADTKDILACLAVEIADDAALFLVREGAPFSVECGQVLVRALQP